MEARTLTAVLCHPLEIPKLNERALSGPDGVRHREHSSEQSD